MTIHSYEIKTYDTFVGVDLDVTVEGERCKLEIDFETDGRDIEVEIVEGRLVLDDDVLLDRLYQHEVWPEINAAMVAAS